jgi:hypothetical protein
MIPILRAILNSLEGYTIKYHRWNYLFKSLRDHKYIGMFVDIDNIRKVSHLLMAFKKVRQYAELRTGLTCASIMEKINRTTIPMRRGLRQLLLDFLWITKEATFPTSQKGTSHPIE